MEQTKEKMNKMEKLDGWIDKAIIGVLPSPLGRAYAAYNAWCNAHQRLLTTALVVTAALAVLTAVINNHYYPNRK